LLAALRNVPALSLRVRQGVDMGRPSLLFASCERSESGSVAKVGGRCVIVMTGTIGVEGDG
jgi:trans-2,3-dihydro-3-hydroxyanthranilate isomerase